MIIYYLTLTLTLQIQNEQRDLDGLLDEEKEEERMCSFDQNNRRKNV